MAKNNKTAKKSSFDKIIAIIVVVLVLAIVLTLAVSVLSGMGVFLGLQSAATVGEINIDGKMMSFFMNDYIMNWYTNSDYSYYVSYFSLDLTRDLKNQKFGQSGYYETSFLGSFNGTWYDYFLKSVKSEVEMYAIYANAAKANGITLSDEDKAEIEETLKGIDSTLGGFGASYADWYGTGVDKGVARSCYELKYLAANYAEKLQADLEAEADADKASIENYRDTHKESFYTADCLVYTIDKTSKGLTEEQFDAVVAAAKADAEKIAAAKTPAEFAELVEKYKADNKITETTTTTSTSTATETESTETESTEAYEKYKQEIKYETETGTNADNRLNDFLFGNDATESEAIAPAEENEAIVIEETGSATEKATTGTSTETETGTSSKTYETYNATVYFVYKPSHFDTELTHSFNYLVSNDKNAIANFIAKFNENETKDLDSFITVADKFYEDMHASEEHEHSNDEMFSYDKAEKASANYFNATYNVLNEWVESPNRVDNELSEIIDITITSTDSTTNKVTTKTQYGVIFFAGHNGETWYEEAKVGLVNEKADEWYKEQQKTYAIEWGDVTNQISTAKTFLASLGY